jgi:prevent-host-death family protein
MLTTAGVRDLKNNLSQYLREVKKGRSIRVTERGKIVATIIPTREHPDKTKLQKLARAGLGTWSGGKPKGASRSVIIKGKTVGEIVIEERR